MMSLYKSCVNAVSRHYGVLRKSSASDHPPVTFDMWFDICRELSDLGDKGSIQALFEELVNLETLHQFLMLGHKRMQLHQMYEKVSRRHGNLNARVVQAFIVKANTIPQSLKDQHLLRLVGHYLASFLIDGGWFLEAAEILTTITNSLQTTSESNWNILAKLLQARSEYRQFDQAEKILDTLLIDIDNNHDKALCDLSYVYCEVSNFYFWKSMYKDSYQWSLKAVKSISASTTPTRAVIDILRQAGKSSVVTRRYPLAQMLLREALLKAHATYGPRHLKYADCLQDYAFYLLNVDNVGLSVQAYEEALTIRNEILGQNNLLVAKLYEELAYATYVHEYSKGNFSKAQDQAETAIAIMKEIIPANHLMVASSQRVLALVLEEIAIDMLDNKAKSSEMLARAEELHLSAVKLTTSAFGEENVQSAKHYGNLGRLYQTMKRFEEAEAMHLKAIDIKEALLGRHDYEVALSIGHLASLYNYDLDEFNKAEELYLRSIEISLRLFGPSYSGLEYDYRGLIRVYEQTGDVSNFARYILLYRSWKDLKDAKDVDSNHPDASTFLTKKVTSRPHSQILLMIEQLNTDDDATISKSRDTIMDFDEIPNDTETKM